MGFWEERTNIAGKVAIVAGGAGGLGRACSLDLGRAGMRLAICDRDEAMLNRTATELRAEGVEVLTGVLDVRDADALDSFFEEVDRSFSVLHVLVNVVGGTYTQAFIDTSPKGWDAIVRTNFLWLVHSTQLAALRMRASGGGSIIHITSIEAHRAAPNFAVYSGMKAAVHNFTRSVAVELASTGIRVNTLAPDMFPTEGSAGLGGDKATDRIASETTAQISVPQGRYGDQEDLGGCVLFLASDLSRYVTGTSVHVDGGTYASGGWFNWPEDGYRNTPPPGVISALLETRE
jgi:3-oxoacyl-[acyl-carrier protein] reductase